VFYKWKQKRWENGHANRGHPPFVEKEHEAETMSGGKFQQISQTKKHQKYSNFNSKISVVPPANY